MPSKLLITTLAGVVLGVAGCGGSGSSAGAAGKSAKSRPLFVYRATLAGSTGTPPGARGGGGSAIVAVHSATVLCWRFAHLHGFTNATGARIQLGSKARSARVMTLLSRGTRLHHRGCSTVPAATTRAIERRPSAYYVAVDSGAYPAGAVRGRL